MTVRCKSIGPKPEQFRCGLPAHHDGSHTALIPSGYPWSGSQPEATNPAGLWTGSTPERYRAYEAFNQKRGDCFVVSDLKTVGLNVAYCTESEHAAMIAAALNERRINHEHHD